jgi:hypothetical protein
MKATPITTFAIKKGEIFFPFGLFVGFCFCFSCMVILLFGGVCLCVLFKFWVN